MPSALTYPGVYVEEIPSGVRTITGVATSITAFVGRARRGPVNKAVTINSFGDFEKKFGGLWDLSQLGFAVRDFFLNGGSQAIIVRLYQEDPANQQAQPPVGSTAQLNFGDFKFDAASPGKWGVYLRVAVDTKNQSDEVAAAMGVTKADLFNLTVVDTNPGGKTESYANLTLKDSPRRVDKVLEAESALIVYHGQPDGTKTPKDGADALSVLEKTLADKKKKLAEKQVTDPSNTAQEQQDVKDAKTALDKGVTDALAAVSDGLWLSAADFLPPNGESLKIGLYALEQ